MTEHEDNPAELGPGERELADHLGGARPVPAPGFRGALGRHLAARDPGYGSRPEHLRLIVAGYAVAGAVLLVAGTLTAVGVL